ncbi:RidA family protein [Amylibacter sp. SFDW26]|uniref:Rid family hydrolase n=1 Tax=Amylibacter sp. SFDW26 TaxID=2652722 RepID=UPI001261E5FA|nr:Rid family hydrolase [Amylibacter sp. SFDW26]KAB7613248.1 RidA family protein [Amylibacter sp. SFDW26]
MGRNIVAPKDIKDLYNAWGFAPAIQSDDLLFIGGQVGIYSDGTTPKDPAQQIEQAFVNMGAVLHAAGATYDDVVDLSAFYTNYPEHGGLARPIREKFFGVETPPNWTAIGVAALAEPFVFEVKAIARVPAK